MSELTMLMLDDLKYEHQSNLEVHFTDVKNVQLWFIQFLLQERDDNFEEACAGELMIDYLDYF